MNESDAVRIPHFRHDWAPMVLLMLKMAPTLAHDSQTCLDAEELLLSLPARAGASVFSTQYFTLD